MEDYKSLYEQRVGLIVDSTKLCLNRNYHTDELSTLEGTLVSETDSQVKLKDANSGVFKNTPEVYVNKSKIVLLYKLKDSQ